MKQIIFVVLLVITCQSISAQIVIHGGNALLDTMFSRRVKSLDEFFSRFNGEETNPDIMQDAKESRENNILALFDKELLMEEYTKNGDNSILLKNVSDFIRTVCQYNLKLEITDTLFFAEAKMSVRFQGKDNTLNLILQMEDKGDDIFCWTISGINGLIDNEMLDTATTYGIRPVDNEMNFIQMRSYLTNQANKCTNYRNSRIQIDPLSYFFAFVNTKQIQLLQCDGVTYHSLSIDGYYFKIDFFNRKDLNSGWLISEFEKIDANGKKVKLNKLLDK